ncbi:MAG: hotdog fold thioesterase, partial [Planctomycetes bacterium]|nr:hotdog fold thioesterase [Planctomycetota bacterium]
EGQPLEKQTKRISKIGSIDMRIDYLRPGTGKEFTAKGKILRTGRKVAVSRMELWNEEDKLIAVGTGTYTVG